MAADRATAMANTAPPVAAGEPGRITPDRLETIPQASSPDDKAAISARPRRPASPETLRLYAVDWAAFEDWCARHGLVPLPARASSVVAFLTEGAATLSAGALTRRAAAIAAKHRQSGFASPAADPTVTAILREARGSATPRRAPRETPATLIRMAVRCPRDLAGMRDRALLLLAASGLGRAALVGLDVEHIHFTRTAAELFSDAVRAGGRAHKDEGRGAPVIVGRSPDQAICPVQALRDWLDTSNTQFGPVFRKIDRWGTLEHHRLGTDAIRRILANRSLRRRSFASSVTSRPRKGRAG